jgi:small subunit ribosomal protein S6
MKDKMNLYEGIYIINASLSEDARGQVVEAIKEQIVAAGGEVKEMIDWGKRRLAYEIDGKREGHYVLLYFDAPSSAVSNFWKEYRLNADIIRFMTLRADEVKSELKYKTVEV